MFSFYLTRDGVVADVGPGQTGQTDPSQHVAKRSGAIRVTTDSEDRRQTASQPQPTHHEHIQELSRKRSARLGQMKRGSYYPWGMPTDKELAGTALHGDDFDATEIEAWYRDEENAYAELYAQNPNYEYEYEPLNVYNGFRHLENRAFPVVCGLGSAYGDELRPIADRIGKLIIIESADSYHKRPALSLETEWRKASVVGDIDLPDSAVDLTTSLGVLHHIPNVSHVVNEIGRITKSGWLRADSRANNFDGRLDAATARTNTSRAWNSS